MKSQSSVILLQNIILDAKCKGILIKLIDLNLQFTRNVMSLHNAECLGGQ